MRINLRKQVDMLQPTCSLASCERPSRSRGLCIICYNRLRLAGSLAAHPVKPRPVNPRRPCLIDGCNGARIGHGLCRHHHTRWRRFGDPLAKTLREQRPTVCTVPGCDVAVLTRAWCGPHYRRVQLYGDPLVSFDRHADALRRFWEKVQEDAETGCMVWTGSRTQGGYGTFGDAGRTRIAHRWLWERENGPVPDDPDTGKRLDLDHLCRNRACVNLAHLEPVTRKENVRRGLVPSGDFCRKGHERTPENVRVRVKTGQLSCRVCLNDSARARYHRKRSSLNT